MFRAGIAQLSAWAASFRAGALGAIPNAMGRRQQPARSRSWQQAYWGSNYERLAEIKKKYDPDGLFIVHNGVGSEGWSRDGFTKL
jgi:FAD/FMN-containing dehydrogenase